MSYGGPLLGLLTTTSDFVRILPAAWWALR